MKQPVTSILLLSTIILLGAVTGYAQLPDPFAVSAFNITDGERFERGNFVIRPELAKTGSDTLQNLNSPPSFIRPGQAVMRKKYGADYRLFLGNLDSAAFRVFPPVYSFPMPVWSRSGQAMWYRFYSRPTANRNQDIETVFFDNERVYAQHYQKIFYSRNDEWDSIVGVPSSPPYGELQIDSEPPGADIYIYGRSTGKRTPAVFRNMIAGRYEVELFLPDYRFQRRGINVPAGGVAANSFQMMSDFDTLYVLGDNQRGILILPYPPIDSAYMINDSVKATFREELLEGDYRVTWNGGGLYKDIDTVITIPPGQMVYFNAPFERLTGTAMFELYPVDALICVEGFPCHLGDLEVELPSGFHTARVSRFGFEPERRRFVVGPGRKYLIKVYLAETADRDYDGFPDSVDRCRDEYGLYEGCPKPTFGLMLKLKAEELNEYMETEPFSFSVSAVGIISRSPTNPRFRNFLSSFSGGLSGGLNNYQGIMFGNIYQASYRGFMTQLELGQWSSGVRFQRPDTIRIDTERDRYLIWYDSLYRIDPAVFFPSAAVSVGFKYRLNNYSVGYSIGYQWEDIVIDEIERLSDREFITARFDNDWWFHELMVEADIFMDMFVTPSLYAKFKFPFGPSRRTRWHAFQFGLQLRMRPANWRNRL